MQLSAHLQRNGDTMQQLGVLLSLRGQRCQQGSMAVLLCVHGQALYARSQAADKVFLQQWAAVHLDPAMRLVSARRQRKVCRNSGTVWWLLFAHDCTAHGTARRLVILHPRLDQEESMAVVNHCRPWAQHRRNIWAKTRHGRHLEQLHRLSTAGGRESKCHTAEAALQVDVAQQGHPLAFLVCRGREALMGLAKLDMVMVGAGCWLGDGQLRRLVSRRCCGPRTCLA